MKLGKADLFVLCSSKITLPPTSQVMHVGSAWFGTAPGTTKRKVACLTKTLGDDNLLKTTTSTNSRISCNMNRFRKGKLFDASC